MNKLILVNIVFVLCSVSLQAQIGDTSLSEKPKAYYWFYIKLGKKLNKGTGTNRIFIKNIGSVIKSGSFDDFIEAHGLGLKSGRIAIGPFSEEHQVQESQLSYKYAVRKSRVPGKKIGKDEKELIYTFFYIKPYSEDFLKDFSFEAIPSRVTNGTQNVFVAMLNEGFHFEKLAVGPFFSYELAEKSKFVYRKNSGIVLENAIDSIKRRKLKIMSKKWKSLKLGIVRKSNDKKLKVSTFRFNTRFPSRYFATDAVQVITIKANYSGEFHRSTNSFTLQGDKVVDNNRVVSSSTSTVYVNALNFDNPDSSKIKGFLIDSFIYNNSEIIELDPVYINVK